MRLDCVTHLSSVMPFECPIILLHILLNFYLHLYDTRKPTIEIFKIFDFFLNDSA
jgi:hypothetical protein